MWRYYWSGKNTVEDFKKTIDIKTLKKSWFLDKNISFKSGKTTWYLNEKEIWNIWIEICKYDFSWYLRVYFIQTDEDWNKKEFDYKIDLVTTKCNYWWVRWWFLCPCKWNRCSILYLQNNWIFASRKTLDLCYEKQKESKKWRYFWYLLWDNFTKILEIRKTMKYPFRNWKPTRKMKRILKLHQKIPKEEDLLKLNKIF